MGEHERGRTSARKLALLWQRAPTRQAGSPEPWEECSCGAHSTAHTTRTTHMSAYLCVREPWASVDAPWHVSWRCHTTACLGSTVPGTGCRIRTEPMPRSEKDVLLLVPTAQRTRRERRVSAHLCIRGHGVGEHERGRTSARELALLRSRAPTRQAGSPEPREECSCRCPQHSAHDANNSIYAYEGHGVGEHERGRTSAHELLALAAGPRC